LCSQQSCAFFSNCSERCLGSNSGGILNLEIPLCIALPTLNLSLCLLKNGITPSDPLSHI
jgi:hypothetical protein